MNILDLEKTIVKECLANVQLQHHVITRTLLRRHPGVKSVHIREAISNLEDKNILHAHTYIKRGDIFPIKEFISMCKSGTLMDDDGTGYILNDDLTEGKEISPPDVAFGGLRPNCEFIIWFNK